MPHCYLLADWTVSGVTPREWGLKVLEAYDVFEADLIVAEVNYGGDMVENTLRAIRPEISFKKIVASRGKAVRAQPVATRYGKLGEAMEIFHVQPFPQLEDQYCLWEPTDKWSPDRLDAGVFCVHELMPVTAPWGFV